MGDSTKEKMYSLQSLAIRMGNYTERRHYNLLPRQAAQPREIQKQGAGNWPDTFQTVTNYYFILKNKRYADYR